MKNLYRIIILSGVLLINGCATVLGVTGANEGIIIDNQWIEYDVTHPGLSIKIIEPYFNDLMPISTVGKSSPSPLKHTITFGKKSNPHKLVIIGKYQKDLYLDGQHYGSVWSGNIVIKDGVLILDNELVSPSKI
ncbi:MAG: hypothetical protein ACI9UT_002526 [Flavobacteriales bacterium]